MAEEITIEKINSQLETMKTGLEAKANGAVTTAVNEAKSAILADVNAQIEKLKVLPADVSGEELSKMKKDLATTIQGFDDYQKSHNKLAGSNIIKSIDEVLVEKFAEHGMIADERGIMSGGELEKALKSQGGTYVIPLGKVNLKAQGADMTLANSLTGDAQATYNNRQSLIPGQKVNFRDFMPTVVSPTGLYVTYSEDSGATNNIAVQTDGATKGQNEYDFTEVKTVTKYIAGFSVFTKQLIKNLPFMQGTLTRALLRDFYKKENALFFSTVSAAATGSTSGGTAPDDVKQLINVLAAQMDADYDPSYILVSNAVMARLIISTYNNGYYAGAGAIAVGQGGVMTIWGIPVYSASWVTSNFALIIDSSYLERVETEGLNLAFSYEDASNFRQNKVTARIECMEEVNFMRAASASYINLGAS